mmetsp:Transcript_43857/g.86465  ORF Transcript_43857/g.86465 Transcript_43857/m.86465 type:complete len:422 (-) Transcript_43857:1359-2624(-)
MPPCAPPSNPSTWASAIIAVSPKVHDASAVAAAAASSPVSATAAPYSADSSFAGHMLSYNSFSFLESSFFPPFSAPGHMEAPSAEYSDPSPSSSRAATTGADWYPSTSSSSGADKLSPSRPFSEEGALAARAVGAAPNKAVGQSDSKKVSSSGSPAPRTTGLSGSDKSLPLDISLSSLFSELVRSSLMELLTRSHAKPFSRSRFFRLELNPMAAKQHTQHATISTTPITVKPMSAVPKPDAAADSRGSLPTPSREPSTPTKVGGWVGASEGPVGTWVGAGVCVGSEEGASVGSGLGGCVGWPVGKDVGTWVGAGTGAWVGRTVGASVGGGVVGSGVGFEVGEEEGSNVGARVGAWVGGCVGSGVGAWVGFSVGDSVGSGDGNGVGPVVGTSVGDSVGGSVGAGVGSSVGSGEGFGVGTSDG